MTINVSSLTFSLWLSRLIIGAFQFLAVVSLVYFLSVYKVDVRIIQSILCILFFIITIKLAIINNFEYYFKFLSVKTIENHINTGKLMTLSNNGFADPISLELLRDKTQGDLKIASLTSILDRTFVGAFDIVALVLAFAVGRDLAMRTPVFPAWGI
jgi:hypothetical protein